LVKPTTVFKTKPYKNNLQFNAYLSGT